MKFSMIKSILIIWLIASSDCGAADMVRKAMCSILLMPLKYMLEQAQKTGILNLDTIINAINDKQCGGDFPLGLFTPTLLAGYYLSKMAPDIISDLFGMQVGFKSTIVNGEVNFYSDGQFDYSMGMNINAETNASTNPSSGSGSGGNADGATFNIKGGVVADENGVSIDINNPIVSKFQELTGFNLEDMSANMQSKLAYLPDGTINVKATTERLELTYSTSTKLGNTDLNGSISLIAERSQNKKENSYSLPDVVASAKTLYEEYAQHPQSNAATVAIMGAATMCVIATLPEDGVAAGAAALSAPMMYLFGSPK